MKFNTSSLKRGQRSQKESHLKTIDCHGLWSEFLLAAVTQLDPLYSWKSPATLDFGSHKTHPKKVTHGVDLETPIFFSRKCHWNLPVAKMDIVSMNIDIHTRKSLPPLKKNELVVFHHPI